MLLTRLLDRKDGFNCRRHAAFVVRSQNRVGLAVKHTVPLDDLQSCSWLNRVEVSGKKDLWRVCDIAG